MHIAFIKMSFKQFLGLTLSYIYTLIQYHQIKTHWDATVLQKDLDWFCTWATTCGMTFNPSKCYAMNINTRKTPKPNFSSMMGQVLTKVNNIIYLRNVVTRTRTVKSVKLER